MLIGMREVITCLPSCYFLRVPPAGWSDGPDVAHEAYAGDAWAGHGRQRCCEGIG